MRDAWFESLSVAPIGFADDPRFDAELDEHHWLGQRMVGEVMRYAATDASGEWVALPGFALPGLSRSRRDHFIGWSEETQLRRLRFVASDQRFCVLPTGRRPNAASAVMSRTLRRLRSDWVASWGHPVLLVETFVDPSRHLGTRYGASSFLRLGQTRGYGRRSGRYVAHGRIKDVYVRAPHRKSVEVLARPFDHPLMSANPRSQVAQIDFNTADLESLIDRLQRITDPRQRRGVRHRFATTLVPIACATLAGHKSLVALSEWCDSSSQEVLTRLGAQVSPATGLRVPPSYATIRRAAMSVDPDELDLIVNTWAAEQADSRERPADRTHRDGDGDTGGSGVNGAPGAALVGVAVDGKTVRGARRDDGTRVQLLAALRHDTGIVVAQRNVENDKTNEILAFAPLLAPLPLPARSSPQMRCTPSARRRSSSFAAAATTSSA